MMIEKAQPQWYIDSSPADAVIGFRLAWNIGDAGWQKSPAYQLMQSLNENRIVGCFCLFDMFVSVFEEVITLRCSVKKFTVSLKHTSIIYITLSLLSSPPELQIFVFAIKFKYFKNSLFYYYYPNFFNMTFNLCFFLLNYFLVRRYLLQRGVHHRLIKT
jgi:hypothetical protein